MKKMLPRKGKGFTLLEILITVVIVSVLAAFVIPRMFHQVEKAKEAEATTNLGAIRSAELRLHAITGQFIAAADEAEIRTSLGLVIGGGFYRYSIIDADKNDFLALATPLGPLSDWLKEFQINKDGFVGYSPGDGGGSSSGGSSSGGSSSGGSGGGSGGGSSGGGGGSIITIPGDGRSYSGPAFTGYTNDINEVLDTLALLEVPLDLDGLMTGKSLASWIRTNNYPVVFNAEAPVDGYIVWGYSDSSVPIISLNNYYTNTKYVYASILAHETSHALWDQDYIDYLGGKISSPQYGMPIPGGGIRSASYTLDNEYSARIVGYKAWYEVTKDVGNQDPRGAISGYDQFLNADGTLKDESIGKAYLRTLPSYKDLPDY